MRSKTKDFATWAAALEDDATVGAGAVMPTHAARVRSGAQGSKTAIASVVRPVSTVKGRPSAVTMLPSTLTFEVAKDANKVAIRDAVQTLFAVKVDSVRIVSARGSTLKASHLANRAADRKKAYVKLAAGEKLPPIFGKLHHSYGG